MDLEGAYFVFDWAADYSEGTAAFAVMQVEGGTLKERFHPNDHSALGPVSSREDQLALDYLVEQGVRQVFAVKYVVKSPTTFLGGTLWYREELTDPDLAPDQWEWYIYDSLDPARQQLLRERGIEVIVLDSPPYITKPVPPPPERPEYVQLSLFQNI